MGTQNLGYKINLYFEKCMILKLDVLGLYYACIYVALP